MPRVTKEAKKNNKINKELEEKLKYLGLDLEKLPKTLLEDEEIKYRPIKDYDETSYKVYQYVDIKKLEILITPTDRLEDISEKFKKADYLSEYIKTSDDEENMEKNAIFLEMLQKLDLKKLQELEEKQEQYKQRLPYEVKYSENFIWQIYYSEVSDKYFMLFPSNESSVESLFYIIKKKIETKRSRKKELIYVPICHLDYSKSFLTKSEIEDLENYLWLFTKEWPSIYEVYYQNGEMTIQIVGKTEVFDNIKTTYKMVFHSKEEAQREFKRIKALFILQTEKSNEYQFKTVVNELGELDLYFGIKNINFSNLSEFIKQEYAMKKIELENVINEIMLNEESLEMLKQTVKRQSEEYIQKEKQIVTFLECKKTFFGKVKYFFQSKKQVKKTKEQKIKELVEEKNLDKDDVKIVKTISDEEYKDLCNDKIPCTIERLLQIGDALKKQEQIYKNMQMDLKALENKKENLDRRIKNATLYINEIESHKKSIFDFWKYTNKDDVNLLTESENNEKQESKEKIKKIFKYEDDIEEVGKKIDDRQREVFQKAERDAIFALQIEPETFKLLDKEKLLKKDKMQIEKNLKKFKKEYEEKIKNGEKEDIEIFGNILENEIHNLNEHKHREQIKDKFKILCINENTTVEEYIENIQNYKTLLKESIEKMTAPLDIPLYFVNDEIQPSKEMQTVYMDAKESLKNVENLETLNLHKYNLQQGMYAIFYSNIMYYDNFNGTLPKGMDVTSKVLVDFENYEIKLIGRKDFRINEIVNEFENRMKIVHVYEYSMQVKNKN